ncbi:mevalonate kinase-like [Camellia sinensis]|uniref:mevalonate kinase-like n=1 Tax=Camellia sinensis TaxID=4442 RepID=UPI001036A4DE|nr:mevalonate kinase-like [Camellia sinensis]
MKLIAALVEEQNILEANTTLAAGVSAFLWLYISIQGYKPAKVVITSELPLGSGLGSSAAFCVSVSAALLALSESVNLDFGHQGWLMFGENELELVNKWAFEGEKIIHGKPSGIDNTVRCRQGEGGLNWLRSGGRSRQGCRPREGEEHQDL